MPSSMLSESRKLRGGWYSTQVLGSEDVPEQQQRLFASSMCFRRALLIPFSSPALSLLAASCVHCQSRNNTLLFGVGPVAFSDTSLGHYHHLRYLSQRKQRSQPRRPPVYRRQNGRLCSPRHATRPMHCAVVPLSLRLSVA